MDFESLSRYILSVARRYNFSFGNRVEIKETIEKNYSVVATALKRIGYQFKNLEELDTFLAFWKHLYSCNLSTNEIICYTDDFLFGYTIPQINKEFDLLRFGKNYNVNVELKSDTTVDKQQDQLRKNHFYLNFLSAPTKYFSFSPVLSSFIEYRPETDEFIQVDNSYFKSIILQQEVYKYDVDDANNLFDIKNYLVSPFNDIGRFLADKYFLTSHQLEIVKNIMGSSDEERLFGIKGNPGTGKSLLIYHIAKLLGRNGKKVAIIHGANLNDGQNELNTNNFNIFPIRNFDYILNNSGRYDFIIIDEAQRLRENIKSHQLTTLCDVMISSASKFIVSVDGKQILSKEENSNNATLLFDFIGQHGKVFSLKDKFRTNPMLSSFIQLLLKRPKKLVPISNKDKNISIKFFYNRNEANEYLRLKDEGDEWVVLNYTKSGKRFPRAEEELDKMCDYGYNSHRVIGQEFNNVVVPMDNSFYYEEKIFHDQKKGTSKAYRLLQTSKSYYPLDKMLYQNLTRTREKLEIVIIENEKLFIEICGILDIV